MQALELTLIVAATRNMGIGANGTMPWTGLRKEMQYFARVTTRIPQGIPLADTNLANTELFLSGSLDGINAVIMGRKTWDSIPSKFRPLKDRLNIVITRSAPALVDPDTGAASEAAGAGAGAEAVKVNSLEAALQLVRARADVGRVFVMGGAQIYDAALKLDEARRVLLTSIDREFDCDAFFPLRLGDGGNTNWIKRPREALEQWTGQEVVEGGQEEAGTQYEFQMWEKDSP